MSIKLVAIDVDDTLIDDKREITAENRKAIARARAQGVRVVLATGRMFSSASPYGKKLALQEPFICYNGALVQAPGALEPTLHRPLPFHTAYDIVSIGERAGLHVNIYLDDRLYVKEFNEYTRFYTTIGGMKAYPVGELLSFMEKPPTKVLYVSEPETITKWQKELEERYKGQLEVYISKPEYLEFTAAGISKGSAVRELAKLYGLTSEEIMTIGDSFNDISMLEYAGIGVAVANAPEEVKAKADYVTASNTENGVAEAINKFVFR
ncbi:MAG: HAD family phosphatase [Firmicutes bacterium]|nr:HAD family phosphatase [Bacillota bacterium]